MRLTVVLPTYNERENLESMVSELLELSIEGVELSILVVDDNSPDGTGDLADQLARAHDGHLQVLHRPEKEGLGKAYLAGFQCVLEDGADLVLQMDCDFSHQPGYIPAMVAAVTGADMVLGSRFAAGGSVDPDWAWWRKLLSWFANRVYVRWILGTGLRDATGGYRLWKRETLLGMDIPRRIQTTGYVFQVEMAYLAERLGYRIVEFPIHFPDRVAGTSKMDSGIQTEAALSLFGVRKRLSGLTIMDRASQPR